MNFWSYQGKTRRYKMSLLVYIINRQKFHSQLWIKKYPGAEINTDNLVIERRLKFKKQRKNENKEMRYRHAKTKII